MNNEEKDLKNNCKPGETYQSPPLEVVYDDPTLSVGNPDLSKSLKWLDNTIRLIRRDKTMLRRRVTTKSFNTKDKYNER